MDWHVSALAPAEHTMQRWLKVVPNMNLGAYEVFTAIGNFPEPEWPELFFSELLRLLSGIGLSPPLITRCCRNCGAKSEGVRDLNSILCRLPYRQVWLVDFEFNAESGERPDPVCLVGRGNCGPDRVSDCRGIIGTPPYPTDERSLSLPITLRPRLGAAWRSTGLCQCGYWICLQNSETTPAHCIRRPGTGYSGH